MIAVTQQDLWKIHKKNWKKIKKNQKLWKSQKTKIKRTDIEATKSDTLLVSNKLLQVPQQYALSAAADTNVTVEILLVDR